MNESKLYNLKGNIESIQLRYNPENDLGSPRVTHTDMLLADICEFLLDAVEDLQKQVDELKAQVKK